MKKELQITKKKIVHDSFDKMNASKDQPDKTWSRSTAFEMYFLRVKPALQLR